MKKNFKKLLTSTLALSMLASSVSLVSVRADFAQKPAVSFFNTFAGYEKAIGRVDNENVFAPDGMGNYNAIWNLDNLSTEVTGSDTALNLSGGVSLAIPFDEVIGTGYLHLSYDMLIPADFDKEFRLTLRQNKTGDSPADIYNAYDEDKGAWTEAVDGELIRANVAADGAGVVAAKASTYFWAGKALENPVKISDLGGTYHKYDFIFDFEDKKVYSFLDGMDNGVATFESGVTGFKKLVFTSSASADNAIYLDNVYVNHYFTPVNASNFDGVVMSADFDKAGAKSDNAVVNLAFSESMNFIGDDNFIPWFNGDEGDDMYAVNTETNQAYYASSAEATEKGMTLYFDNLPSGEYIIKVNPDSAYSEDAGEAYFGKISGTKIANDATFFVSGEAQGTSANRKYYLKEDFNGYTGGIPIGATSISYKNEFAVIAKEARAAGDSAMRINAKSADGLIFDFDEAIQDGKIYIEFDVLTNGQKWGVGLTEAADVSPVNYIESDQYAAVTGTDSTGVYKASKDSRQSKAYNQYLAEAKAAAGESFDQATWDAETWPGLWKEYLKTPASEGYRKWYKQDDRTSGMVVGNFNTSDLTQLQYSLSAKANTGYTSTDSGLDVPTNEWTHVKVVVNMEAQNFTVTVGDKTATSGIWNSGKYTKRTMYDTNTGNKAYFSGIQGLVLRAVNGEVCFDNFEVYTDNSYNTFNDFNGFSEALNNYTSWGKPTEPVRAKNKAAATAPAGGDYAMIQSGDAGVNSQDANDRGLRMRVYKGSSEEMRHLFNVPVKAGRAFDVEFDLKTGTENNTFVMMLGNENDVYSKADNTRADATAWETGAKGTISTGAWGKSYAERICLMNTISGTPGVSPGYYTFANGRTWTKPGVENKALSADGTEVPFVAGKWQHVKFSYIPKTDGVYFKLTTTVDGVTVTSNEFKSNIPLTEEIGCIGFSSFANSAATGAFDMTIDNFKVSEVEPTENAYITSVNVVGLNGEKRAFDGTFTNADSYIEINSSKALLNTDGIGLYDGTYSGANIVGNVAVVKELTNNNKTVKLSFNTLPAEGKSLTLYVNSDQAIERDSYLSKMESFRTAITFDTVEGEAVIESLRLWQDFGTKQVYRNGETEEFDLGAAPLATDALKGKSVSDDIYFVATGYNTGDAFTVKAYTAGTIAGRLDNATVEDVTIPSGRFAIEIPVSFTTAQDGVGGFLWDVNYKPLVQKAEYTLTNTVE